MRGTDPISARNAGFDLEASALADGLTTLGPRRLPTASERLRPEAVQNGCEALTQSVHATRASILRPRRLPTASEPWGLGACRRPQNGYDLRPSRTDARH
jgi:hypothetical protein